MGVIYVRLPGWVSVGKDWTDELFIDLGDVFLEVTIISRAAESDGKSPTPTPTP